MEGPFVLLIRTIVKDSRIRYTTKWNIETYGTSFGLLYTVKDGKRMEVIYMAIMITLL